MTDYALKDFMDEIDTVLWEKRDTLEKAQRRHNEPVAGLTQIRIDRLMALKAYLDRIHNFQAGGRRAAGENIDAPEKTLPPEEKPKEKQTPIVDESAPADTVHDELDW